MNTHGWGASEAGHACDGDAIATGTADGAWLSEAVTGGRHFRETITVVQEACEVGNG
jgi:hypothetical protein